MPCLQDRQKHKKAMELSPQNEQYLLFCSAELPGYQKQEVHISPNKYIAIFKNGA